MLTKQHSPVPFFRLAGSLTPTQTLILLPPRLLPQRSMLSQKKKSLRPEYTANTEKTCH